MQCINSSNDSKFSIEEPCAGKPQARFCGGIIALKLFSIWK